MVYFELPNDPQDIISFGGSDNASGVDFRNLSLSHKASSSTSRVVSALTSLRLCKFWKYRYKYSFEFRFKY